MLVIPAPRWTFSRHPGPMAHLPPNPSGKLTYTDTDELGVYRVAAGGKLVRQFAVNLLDPAESEIRPPAEPSIKIGYVEVAGKTSWGRWPPGDLAGTVLCRAGGRLAGMVALSPPRLYLRTRHAGWFSPVAIFHRRGAKTQRMKLLALEVLHSHFATVQLGFQADWGCTTAGNFGIRPPMHGVLDSTFAEQALCRGWQASCGMRREFLSQNARRHCGTPWSLVPTGVHYRARCEEDAVSCTISRCGRRGIVASGPRKRLGESAVERRIRLDFFSMADMKMF